MESALAFSLWPLANTIISVSLQTAREGVSPADMPPGLDSCQTGSAFPEQPTHGPGGIIVAPW